MPSLAALDCPPAVVPPLEPGFRPAALANRSLRVMAERAGPVPLRLALERSDGSVSLYETIILPPNHEAASLNLPYVERIVKFLLWQRGGCTLHVGGPPEIADHLRGVYAPDGARAFDYDFMSSVYERPFTVVSTSADRVPEARESSSPLGRHLDGCRVGFDLGASDRKSSAVIDGKPVFTIEVPWDPRSQSDPAYHYEGIMHSIKVAAEHMPRLDAVGGSAAGVYIANRVRVASLFRGVPRDVFDRRVAGMFIEIGRELGVPLEVVNDGEVTALAGSMSLEDNPVLGIAMGSSEAAGYVTSDGNITGWLNELAFAPVDYRDGAPADEWSGDIGCGVQYFSQQGAIRIAEAAGMRFDDGLGLPEKLEALQSRMRDGDATARGVYESIGACLGYAVAHYADFYDLKHVLVLGRVTTGVGGDIIVETAQRALHSDFPQLAAQVDLALPDEKARRVGQSIAAASLPAIGR